MVKYEGAPTFNENSKYMGPLPGPCGHNHRKSLKGKNKVGKHHTKEKEEYPSAMNSSIAIAILRHMEKAPQRTEIDTPFRWGGPGTITGDRPKARPTVPKTKVSKDPIDEKVIGDLYENKDRKSVV